MSYNEGVIDMIRQLIIHTSIIHCCNNFTVFVRTTELYGIGRQNSTQIKIVCYTVVRREYDEISRVAGAEKFYFVVGLL